MSIFLSEACCLKSVPARYLSPELSHPVLQLPFQIPTSERTKLSTMLANGND